MKVHKLGLAVLDENVEQSGPDALPPKNKLSFSIELNVQCTQAWEGLAVLEKKEKNIWT